MREKPSVAICIPCFRRPELLQELLNSIVSTGFAGEVSIYLFDDSPEKANSHLENCFCKYFDGFHYQHNSARLGIDRNISQCLYTPSEDFVWLMGEDDLVKPDSLRLLYNQILNKPGVTLAFVNYVHFEVTGEKQLDLDFKAARLSKQSFIDSLLISFGFIGSVLVRRSALPASNDYLDVNSYFSHIGLLLDLIDKSDYNSLQIITEPVVLNRVGRLDAFSWADDALRVYQGFGQLLEAVQSRRPCLSLDLEYVKSLAYSSFHPLAKPSRIIRLRAEGAMSAKDLNNLNTPNIKNKLALLPLVLMPIFVAKFLVYVHSQIKHFRCHG